MENKLEILVLSALLHDIGKFAQRASRPYSEEMESEYLTDFKGRPGHWHTVYSDYFLEKDLPLPKELEESRSLIARIASAHHRPDEKSLYEMALMIADRLSKNQRYEDAQKWFHYIFDPTDTSSFEVPRRYWRTKPFHERTREGYQRERIQYILKLLAAGANPQKKAQLSADEKQDLERFEKAVAAWRKDPFKPHLIARMRTTAYQKTVVMKYLDNLLAWGDQLFRRDTIESINEATQLYILAAEILGRRPEDIPPRATPRVQTYNSLEPSLDAFSNALVQIEEFVSASANGGAAVGSGQQPSLTLPGMLYFCVPKNDKLLAYWDTVADRLFKIATA